MGVGTVNIWIADVADPCKISNATWLVTVADCENRVIQWCDRVYEAIEARCGHAELELPPGCYIVFGVLRVPLPPPPPPFPPPPFPFINYTTHSQVLTLGCDERACVRLYAPTYRRCWDDVWFATQLLVRQEAISQDLADQVARTMNAALENAPRTDVDAELQQLHERLASTGIE
jgi:hypothetical protein